MDQQLNVPTDGSFTARMHSEISRARARFPDQNIWITLAALTEEVGELNQAILQFNHEPHRQVTSEKIYKEAIQVAVMAMRVALDCEYCP